MLFRRIEARARATRRSSVDRGRSAAHRDRGGRRPAPRDRARHRRRAVPRRCCTSCCWDELRRPRLRRRAHGGLRRARRRSCATSRPRVVAQTCGIRERRPRRRPRAGSRDGGRRCRCTARASTSRRRAPRRTRRSINLHLATGQIGKPGAGPFSLTGQPNAMGGREVGGMANLLSGAPRPRQSRASRRGRALWGVADVPATPGPHGGRALRRARRRQREDGVDRVHEPRAVAARPGDACARRSRAPSSSCCRRRTRHRDGARSPTCCCRRRRGARRTARSPTPSGASRACAPRSPPPGEARADWEIAADFARRLERRLRPARADAVSVRRPRGGLRRARETTRGRDLDITGLSYAMLDATGRSSGRSREARRAGRARLYTDGTFRDADGRARFAAVAYTPVAERVRRALPVPPHHRPAARPVARHEPHRHASRRCSRTRGEPAIECTGRPRAPRPRGGRPRARRVARGSVLLPVVGNARRRAGQRFLPMHWGSATLAGRGSPGINAVTRRRLCPTSKQPELKHAAVRIAKADLPWRLVAFGYPAHDERAGRAARRACATRARRLDYASVVLIGQRRAGVLLRVAAAAPSDAGALADDRRGVRPRCADVVRYDDPGARSAAACASSAAGSPRCACPATLPPSDWLRGWLDAGERRALRRAAACRRRPPRAASARAGASSAPATVSPRTPSPRAATASTARRTHARRVQDELKCGTGCGSCLPELKQLIACRRRASRHGGRRVSRAGKSRWCGAGPGDPELLTLKAVRALARSRRRPSRRPRQSRRARARAAGARASCLWASVAAVARRRRPSSSADDPRCARGFRTSARSRVATRSSSAAAARRLLAIARRGSPSEIVTGLTAGIARPRSSASPSRTASARAA